MTDGIYVYFKIFGERYNRNKKSTVTAATTQRTAVWRVTVGGKNSIFLCQLKSNLNSYSHIKYPIKGKIEKT